MPLHPGQVKYLRETTSRKTKVNVLVPSNRWGKSSMIACKQIWYLFYKFGVRTGNREAWGKAEYRTANIAPKAALIEPVFKYIDQILTSRFPINLPDGRIVTNKCMIEWFYQVERTNNSPPFKQYMANGSYIEHRTIGQTGSDSLEGKPYGYISYDEAGRSDHLEDEINGTLLARLFDWQGPLDLVSTPDQNSQSILHHYKLYQDGLVGLNSTYTQQGALRDNIFFSKEQIDSQYELYQNNPLRDQVLEGKFVFGGDNFFNAEDILQAQDEALNDGIRYIEGHKYVIGVDTAMGSDEMVYTVTDVTDISFNELDQAVGNYQLVRQIANKGNTKSPQVHLNDFVDLVYSYWSQNRDNLWILLETWNGESARFYQDLPYEIQNITRCYGSWQPHKNITGGNKNATPRPNNNVKKADILLALRKAIASKRLKIPNEPKLVQQLSIYREDDEKIPTDRVMALALACWMADEGMKVEVEEVAWTSVDW